ncbi:hypothetical protein MF672_011075 [Actinomadura sp. ATCC 31491]|uniref:SPOR domain-containing protein n=1 Tax=Actinomadura luzonensis TaxID=2805427 RepID=A0ABT0FPQ5_9ACTN|nr:hypothetical protein [Actinomadura luzonensis]MCK2214330.1 hypothetical protein [Actinomadura luzonensis]
MGQPRQPDLRDYPGLVTTMVAILVVLLPGGFAFSVYKRLNASAPDTTAALPAEEPGPEPAQPSPSESENERAGSPMDDDDFSDWNFRLGNVTFKAKKVGGWTYDSCKSIDRQGVLARNKCERAVQLAYSAYRGHLTAVQVIMSFPTVKAAKATAARLATSSSAVKWRRDTMLSKYVYGKTSSGATKTYVLLTVVTADKTAQAKAAQFQRYLHKDHWNYFRVREATVTN